MKKHIASMQEELAALESGLAEESRKPDSEIIRFVLDGCDISFIAEAPADITLRQLLAQCDKIRPDWCACGINSDHGGLDLDLIIGYDSITKANEDVSCQIMDDPKWREKQ